MKECDGTIGVLESVRYLDLRVLDVFARVRAAVEVLRRVARYLLSVVTMDRAL